jgi:hypothetical protein
MSHTQFAACAHCDKEDCWVVVILPAVPAENKKVDRGAQILELMCPACSHSFSVSFRAIEYYEVTDEQLLRGFIRE